jgi:hypothetical protein
MDAKTRDLALLTVLSLFCAAVAWISDYSVLGLSSLRSVESPLSR